LNSWQTISLAALTHKVLGQANALALNTFIVVPGEGECAGSECQPRKLLDTHCHEQVDAPEERIHLR